MSLVYQQNINEAARIGLWHIEESESFFLQQVPLQRNITHPVKRLQHLAGRYLLKVLYPGFPHELIEIAATRKPFLPNEAYHFSISHCGKYAAALISPQYRVGTDIEWCSPKIAAVRHKFLSEAEQLLLKQADGSLSHSLLTAAWAAKESVYKWYGQGEVNFKGHIQIKDILLQKEAGTIQCRFTKETDRLLRVDFLFFDQHCLAWVLT